MPQRFPRQLPIAGARESIVREDGMGRDHAEIADLHACADVDDRVQLDVVADHDVIRDVGLLADDAVVADARAASDVDAVPDPRVRPEGDAFLDEGGRVDPGGARVAHGPLSIRSQWLFAAER